MRSLGETFVMRFETCTCYLLRCCIIKCIRLLGCCWWSIGKGDTLLMKGEALKCLGLA